MLVDSIPPIRHGVGRPRRRPLKLRGDKAYDSEKIRRELRRRGIKPLLNRRRKPRRHRKLWPVERTQAWINQYRRLKVRYERLQCTYQAFLNLACALICYKRTSGRKMGRTRRSADKYIPRELKCFGQATNISIPYNPHYSRPLLRQTHL